MAIKDSDVEGYFNEKPQNYERFYQYHDPFDPQIHFANIDNYFRQMDAHEIISRRYKIGVDTSYAATKKRQDDRETHRRTFEGLTINDQVLNMLKFEAVYRQALEYDRDQQYYKNGGNPNAGSWASRHPPAPDIPMSSLPPGDRKRPLTPQEIDMSKKTQTPPQANAMAEALASALNTGTTPELKLPPGTRAARPSRTTVTMKATPDEGLNQPPVVAQVTIVHKDVKEESMNQAAPAAAAEVKDPVITVKEVVLELQDPFQNMPEELKFVSVDPIAEALKEIDTTAVARAEAQAAADALHSHYVSKRKRVVDGLTAEELQLHQTSLRETEEASEAIRQASNAEVEQYLARTDIKAPSMFRDVVAAPGYYAGEVNKRFEAATSWFRK